MPKLFRAKNGFDRNPFLSLPRNMPCPCVSGKKFKQCCLKTIHPVVPYHLAREWEPLLKTPHLIRFELEIKESSVPFREEQLPMREEATA